MAGQGSWALSVTAVRGWGSADAKLDAVLVAWDKQSDGRTFVYRFGVLAPNGARRVYDVVMERGFR
jgi:hypothetical protein